jgi:glutamate-1-semialdehyde 2,1-aminomutase
MGLVPPQPGFLEGLRELTRDAGALLIFDEVITGFRLAPTAYSATVGIDPDLTTLGKILGGGAPIGALGGRAEVMDVLAPDGPVYQAGTLSGNPLAVAAGLATLRALTAGPPYGRMAGLAETLAQGVTRAAGDAGVPFHCAQLGGMFTPFFRTDPVHSLPDAKQCCTEAHARFFHLMLDAGFYLPPSQFEVAFVSAAHTAEDIDAFMSAAAEAFGAMASSPV